MTPQKVVWTYMGRPLLKVSTWEMYLCEWISENDPLHSQDQFRDKGIDKKHS